MAHRHKMQMRAKGGRVAYEGGESNVAKESHEGTGANRGGRMKHGGKVEGHKGKKRYARGGGVSGADKHPFSSAHRD